ncbi:MAG: diaminopimelate decarboxylase, partial [Cytophagales bacterium]|nr:diaminopimelate decarboxylase [Cytophagales bacterium]
MELKEGKFTIQGIDTLELAKQFGTPVYVYDAQIIEDQFLKLKHAFGDIKVRIKYATKALPNISILKLLKKLGSGADAVSIQEIYLALKAGFEPRQLMFTPNCVNYSEIEEAVRLGVQINIDNLPFLERFGKQYGSTVPCCIRINPHVAAGGNVKIQTGHKESKFGIS